MDSSFSLRTALQSDIDFIMKVEESSFIKSIQESREVFLKRIGVCPHLFLIFQFKDIPAGYISAELMHKIPQTAEELKLGHEPELIKTVTSSDFIYISSFALLPEYRGKGAGKINWNNAINYFEGKGFKNFLLLVNKEWVGAAHIYEESGFSKIAEFKDFFPSEKSEKSDGILMQMIK